MASDSVKNLNKSIKEQNQGLRKFFFSSILFILFLSTSTEVTLFNALQEYSHSTKIQSHQFLKSQKISLKLFCKCKNVINSYINGFSTLYRLLL